MDTREKIMTAALELFARDGYEAVSVSMIAGELGLTKGALYKHYANKRDIFDSIVRRMEEMDYSNAKSFQMPEDLFESMPEEYKNTQLEQVCAYTLAQYIYWTEDGFASRFRKMISLERYRNEEMETLYQQYLGLGPLNYMEDVLGEIFGRDSAAGMPGKLAMDYYAPVYMLINLYDSVEDKAKLGGCLKEHMESFVRRIEKEGGRVIKSKYVRSEKYRDERFMKMIMGPNPIKLEEELLNDNLIAKDATVCDLGSGTGLTSVFLQKEYDFTVYAADLWSDPEENRKFFDSLGLDRDRIIPVKADATALPFEKAFFDAVVSIDSYNYFGRDPRYLSDKLLPFLKSGAYIYIAIPGMKKDCHDALPPELLLSWTPEQMDFMHDTVYWRKLIEQTPGVEILSIHEMESNEEVWDDWLRQDNEYAVGDRKSMESGAGKYLNFIAMILRKK